MPDPLRIHEIIERLRGLHFTSDRDREVAAHLDRLLISGTDGRPTFVPLRFGKTRETRGILVSDAPGGGKSTLLQTCLTKHPALVAGPSGLRPWIAATVPSPASHKAMLFALLKETGFQIEATRRTIWELVEILRLGLAQNGQGIVWIDEAHDLFCKDQDSILRFVKSLMQGDGAVIVILSGTWLLDDIVRSDPQVQRRFTTVRPPTLTVAHDGGPFAELIETCCARAGLAPPTATRSSRGCSMPRDTASAARSRP